MCRIALAFAATSSLATCAVALIPATPACAEILVPAAAHSPALPSKEDIVSHPASTPNHPSPPHVLPIEHGGVRYEQDTARQTRPDAERGGWLVAKDAANGKQLWRVQLYTNPYDAGSPVGSPPRWFQRMHLTADRAAIEIEDDIGTIFLVDLATRAVTLRKSPSLSPSPRAGDRRPQFD
ncbi:hypothetical protein Q4S45_11585 [Massilia sp. R2A-15]|uniref:hypothetical protein n=1 Tax=Massilia sp. R2A-15 TaxID=3064278 RepID=UPI0027327936|nr:hypothetical protein [Massilia sp. R2A-15]WLI87390.1 hypothetical protein Q4S45_11585 [Massilia sp. R2A-15]